MTLSNKNLKNQAYQTIKDRLINCVYPPGSFLNGQQLALDLNISRTPIREAISQLEFDNLVHVVPKKGILVSDITLTDIQQIFQTRLEVEPMTLRLAMPYLPMAELEMFRQKFAQEQSPDVVNDFRLDTAMHLFIIEHCGNKYLIQMMQKVFEENTRVIISSNQNRVHIHDARMEHLEIINTLIAQDMERAVSLMRTHVEGCRRAALDHFSSVQAHFSAATSTYRTVLEKMNS